MPRDARGLERDGQGHLILCRPNAEWAALLATSGDDGAGPEGICDVCTEPLENLAALQAGRCALCLVMGRQPADLPQYAER